MRVQFNNYTDDALGVVLTSTTISAPVVKTNYVQVPGRNGSIDLSEFFGSVRYEDRTITMNFESLDPGVDVWENVANVLHGRKFSIVFADDPDYHYTGRVSLDAWRRNRSTASFTLTALCEPYKTKSTQTTKSLTTGNNAVTGLKMPVVPTFVLTTTTRITFGDYVTTLSAGTYQIPSIELKEGTNTINVSAPCTIKYTEGSL